MTRFSVSQQTKSLATYMQASKQERKKDLEERRRGTNQGLETGRRKEELREGIRNPTFLQKKSKSREQSSRWNLYRNRRQRDSPLCSLPLWTELHRLPNCTLPWPELHVASMRQVPCHLLPSPSPLPLPPPPQLSLQNSWKISPTEYTHKLPKTTTTTTKAPVFVIWEILGILKVFFWVWFFKNI